MNPAQSLAVEDAHPHEAVRREIHAGLAQRPKSISPKFFYDRRGCELFDEICRLPEYYPTRSEVHIMRLHAAAMADTLGRDGTLIEIGSGSGEKTRLLLEELRPHVYVPIDIAVEQLDASRRQLGRAFPQMSIVPIQADFTQPFDLPRQLRNNPSRRALYFPGSTIGNFPREQARALLRRWRTLLGPGGKMLIGVDLKKDPRVLQAAYDDAAGVTAAFNLNLLERLNRELDAGFDLRSFRHKAIYRETSGRIEMHLESLRAQTVEVAGMPVAFASGETILTEISCKYSLDEFRMLGRGAGYRPLEAWVDPAGLFSVHCLQVMPDAATHGVSDGIDGTE